MKTTNEVIPFLKKVRDEMELLGRLRIKVGIQGDADSDILTIARVHEYGATITAKSAKNLCIPINKQSYGKSPRDFPDLFFITSEAGYVFGVVEKQRKRKKGGDDLVFLFLLLPSVTIPERSFIRAGYDANKDRLAEVVQAEVAEIYQGRQTARKAAEWIGGKAVEFIQQYMEEASHFTPKGSIQRDRAPSYADKPLIVTGRLRNSITFKVEES